MNTDVLEYTHLYMEVSAMSKTLAVINQKGGVGKSTTALALAGGLAGRGFRVLCMDLDAQGNLSFTFSADTEVPTAMDVLSGEAIASAIQQVPGLPGLSLVASSPFLANADVTITQTGKEYRMREALSGVSDAYDFIVIDTPPALGILTINALTAATDAIIPAQADIYSLQGIGQLYSTLEAVRKYTNPQLRIMGILLTRFNARAILSRDITEMTEATAKQLNTEVFSVRIRESIAVREAQASRRDLFSYAPKSNAAVDYQLFVDDVIERSGYDGKKEL